MAREHPQTQHRWTYPVRDILRNYDGDSVTCLLDMGFKVCLEKTVRINGVDTPELRGGTPLLRAAARYAQGKVAEFLAAGPLGEVLFVSYKWSDTDQYGRPVGDIEVDGKSLSYYILNAGLGVPYGGEGRKTKEHQASLVALAKNLAAQGKIIAADGG